MGAPYRFGSFELSADERVIRRAGAAVPLAPKTIDMLNTVRNECWRSIDYYACHQFVNGKSAESWCIPTHVIVGGTAPASGGILQISGNTWTYPWQDKDESGKTLHARIVNTFRDSNTIAFRQEVSLDDRTWIRTADGEEHRLHS